MITTINRFRRQNPWARLLYLSSHVIIKDGPKRREHFIRQPDLARTGSDFGRN